VAGGKAHILVIDYQADSLRLITQMLTNEGYEVRQAGSSELALASAQENTPELILLDINMPAIDAFEVCRRLQAGRNTRSVPVLFMGAPATVEQYVECFRVGAVAILNKPLVREELLARVQAHLELGRSCRQLEEEVAQRTAAMELAYERLQRELMERQKAERALRESEERFGHMADTAPVMIWISGPDKLVTFLNKRWLQFRGRSMEQELGHGWAEGVHADDFDHCLMVYTTSFDARRDFEMEYRLRRADGEYRWILDHGIPRFTPNGDFAGYIGSCIDITEMKRSNEARLAAQKMESLGVLAAGIAHDFNNLLGSILAGSDLALSQIPAGSEARQQIQRIISVASRASEIVDLLVDYAGGKHVPVQERVDISDLVGDLLQLIEPSLSNGAKLTRQLARNLPAIMANAPQIRRIVMNLVKNASEALERRQGTITVKTELEHIENNPPGAAFASLPEGDYVRVSVADTGSGMTEESLAKAFDAFYTTKFPGRGLGLSVVQGIVQSHGGAIRVSSKQNCGTTVEVLLPVL